MYIILFANLLKNKEIIKRLDCVISKRVAKY